MWAEQKLLNKKKFKVLLKWLSGSSSYHLHTQYTCLAKVDAEHALIGCNGGHHWLHTSAILCEVWVTFKHILISNQRLNTNKWHMQFLNKKWLMHTGQQSAKRTSISVKIITKSTEAKSRPLMRTVYCATEPSCNISTAQPITSPACSTQS